MEGSFRERFSFVIFAVLVAFLFPSITVACLSTPVAQVQEFEPIALQDLQVAFNRPSGWQMGTYDDQYLTKSFSWPNRQNITMSFSINASAEGNHNQLSEDELLKILSSVRDNYQLLETRSAKLDGNPSATALSRWTSQEGQHFQIVVMVSTPKRDYLMFWMSNNDYEQQLRKIHEKMLPTFRFTD